MPTQDMRKLSDENDRRDRKASKLEKASLVQLDAMFLESQENLAAISDYFGVSSSLGHSAARIREALRKSQERYDNYFIKANFNAENQGRIIRGFAYDLAKYLIFIEDHSESLSRLGHHIKSKYLHVGEDLILGSKIQEPKNLTPIFQTA